MEGLLASILTIISSPFVTIGLPIFLIALVVGVVGYNYFSSNSDNSKNIKEDDHERSATVSKEREPERAESHSQEMTERQDGKEFKQKQDPYSVDRKASIAAKEQALNLGDARQAQRTERQ